MYHKFFHATVFLASMVITAHAAAHEVAPTYDRINFGVSASKEVANDTLVAIMYLERSGQQPSAMADDVNRTVAWAVELAKKNRAVKVQTLEYRQEPQYRNQSVVGWKIRQSIRLESTDHKALSMLIGELQERLSVASMHYSISPDTRMEVENQLIAEALDRFAGRGKLIAGEMGRPDYRVVVIDVVTSDSSPVPVRTRAVSTFAESSSVAPPTLEAGVATVTVQVSGTIELEIGR